VAASGLPGFEALQWFGLFAPAGTPQDVVARLNANVAKALKLPDVQEKLQGLGMQVAGIGPDAFAGFIRTEAGKWGEIVKDSGAKVY
jgi:tripartite-type tricarboxylate transporter receptor subunit TctC